MFRANWQDQILYDYAMSMVGTPYLWGGDDPMSGFDCSGAVQELLWSTGLLNTSQDLTSQGIYYFFERDGRATFQSVAQFGALVFYGESTSRITHIAFALDAYRVWEAGGGGSKTNTRADAERDNAFIRIRHIDNRRDQVAILKPFYYRIAEI